MKASPPGSLVSCAEAGSKILAEAEDAKKLQVAPSSASVTAAIKFPAQTRTPQRRGAAGSDSRCRTILRELVQDEEPCPSAAILEARRDPYRGKGSVARLLPQFTTMSSPSSQ